MKKTLLNHDEREILRKLPDSYPSSGYNLCLVSAKFKREIGRAVGESWLFKNLIKLIERWI